MITATLPRHVRRVVLPMAAGALLAGMPMRATLAQQPAASDAGGAVHAAPSGENKGGGVRAPPLKIAPTRERSIVRGGSNLLDRNAIGMPVARPDGSQRPAAPNLGRAATLASPAPPAPSGAPAVLGSRGLQAPRIPAPVPAPRPLIWSRGTIDGAALTRPGTALKPLGGPAKAAATGINGTNFQPKH